MALCATVAFGQPTAGPTAPTEPAANVLSLFSDAYTDVTVDTWRTPWSDGTLTEEAISGDNVKKYTSLNFVGVETVGANLVDASGYAYIHFDAYTTNATAYALKLVDFGANEAWGDGAGNPGGDDTEHEIEIASPSQNTWNSHHIALADFTSLANRDNLAQYIFSADPAKAVTLYIDNVYFHNNAALLSAKDVSSEFSAYPNPFSSHIEISAAHAVEQVRVFDISGKEVLRAAPNKAHFRLNTAHLNKGVYMMSLESAGQSSTAKLIK